MDQVWSLVEGLNPPHGFADTDTMCASQQEFSSDVTSVSEPCANNVEVIADLMAVGVATSEPLHSADWRKEPEPNGLDKQMNRGLIERHCFQNTATPYNRLRWLKQVGVCAFSILQTFLIMH